VNVHDYPITPRPGNDPRQWTSYGLVKADTPQSRSVLFVDEQGNPRPYPVVLVTLQPSGIDVACRVAGQTAGAGTGEWHPFVAGDEVVVSIMQGDEHDCVITGRLGQAADAFPTMVGGNDPTQNNVAFKRVLEPYILESGTALLFRTTPTGAFLSIGDTGNVVAQSGDGHYLALQHDQLSIQTADLSCCLQIDPSAQTVFLQAGPTQLLLDSAGNSAWVSEGALSVTAGNGGYALGHAITLEQVVAIFNAFGVAASLAATTPISLVAFFASLSAPATLSAILEAATVAPTGSISAFSAAIASALQVPPDPTGTLPGIGRPSFLY
jgi:hypothetical protein